MSHRLRLLYILNTLTLRGAQLQLRNTLKSFPPACQAEVFVFGPADNATDWSVTVHSVSGRSSRQRINRVFALIRLIRSAQYDVIITSGTGSSLFWGRLIGYALRVPLCYSTLHTSDNLNNRGGTRYFEFPNQILNRLLASCRRPKYRFLPVCDSLTEKIRQLAIRYDVSTLHNGIILDELRDCADNRLTGHAARLEDVACNFKTIIQIGTLDANKNQISTIMALEPTLRERDDTRVLFLGDGPATEELRILVQSKNLSERILISGHLRQEDCFCLMAKATIVVLTSRSEGFPNVLVEAQALGIPVVTFDVGGASEIVQNNLTGFVVKNGDLTYFRECVERILSDPKMGYNMGVAGRNRVATLFTMNIKIERFLDILKGDQNLLNDTKPDD